MHSDYFEHTDASVSDDCNRYSHHAPLKFTLRPATVAAVTHSVSNGVEDRDVMSLIFCRYIYRTCTKKWYVTKKLCFVQQRVSLSKVDKIQVCFWKIGLIAQIKMFEQTDEVKNLQDNHRCFFGVYVPRTHAMLILF